MSRRKEMVKIRVGIIKIENRKTIEKINETKNRFCEKFNKIDKLLARWTKIKREKKQITNPRNKTGYCSRLQSH